MMAGLSRAVLVRSSRLAGLGLLLWVLSGAAVALDFRSVGADRAILYDAPSTQAKRLFVVSKYYPVEIIVNLDQWAKVRDSAGGLAWIEKKNLSDTHTVVVTAARADVRKAADPNALLVFQAERDVALELVEYGSAGWLKVRHRDGAVGFVLASQVWGS
jgi:SH3-like domain-containing protein